MKPDYVSAVIGSSVLCAGIVVHDAGLTQSSTTSIEHYKYDAHGQLVKVATGGGQADAETRSISYDGVGKLAQYAAITPASDPDFERAFGGGGSTGDVIKASLGA